MDTTHKHTPSHTPGPWAIVEPESGGWAVQWRNMVTESKNGGYVSAICPGPDGEANARLIAAAPDLLAAARAAEDRISAWMDGERAAQLAAEQRNDRHAAEGHWNAWKNYEALLSTLRAAIAKATTGE